MLRLTPEQKAGFAAAVRLAAGSPFLERVDAVYQQFESERASRKPHCAQSGDCCRFEAYGHRLFVTVMEAAHFRRDAAGGVADWDGSGCPFQVGGLCSRHPVRPFGCRVFFCDRSSTAWQQEQYERFHGQIRELHDLAGVPYLYVEWREALDALGVSPQATRSTGRPLTVLNSSAVAEAGSVLTDAVNLR
jgi:Fe-S-cluster containining protein